MNLYESDDSLSQYLLFHYGSANEILPYPFGPHDALDYAARTVTECVDPARLPKNARALDLGCAVGRSAFELAASCSEVVGIDYSQRFIEAARTLASDGRLPFKYKVSGEILADAVAQPPSSIDRSRVAFETGDAMNPRDDLGRFDVVHMANLVDRLEHPARCLERLPDLMCAGGQLVITTPSTWSTEFTPPENWLGGRMSSSHSAVTTLDGLLSALDRHFTLERHFDMPFLIREHARKFQWSVAEATVWIRNAD